MREHVWRSLKMWRQFALGPVSVLFRFHRPAKVTAGHVRRASAARPTTEAVSRSRHKEVAVVVGVGPGFGVALADLLADEGFDLVLVCRDARRLSSLAERLHSRGVTVETIGADATDEAAVTALFRRVCQEHGQPALVVYSLQYSGPGTAVEIEAAAFEDSWRHNCFGAFLVGRAAGRLMADRGTGTIVFVGSTSSLIGRAAHLNLAVGKFGQRALAQVMARELWPKGVHVAHAVVDADIHEGGEATSSQADPAHIAASILALHRQPKTAWTSELDLRPWNESFWEHC
jgi:NAD(P)-dependent dehydrogenase (short-subunit alcohol dehydrogenase family)